MNDEYEQYKRLCEKLGVETLFQFYYCPDCGKILNVVKIPIWSQDHSLKIGYTRSSACLWCSYSEVYTDVE